MPRFKKWASFTATSTSHVERRISLVDTALTLGAGLLHPDWFDNLHSFDRMTYQTARLNIRQFCLNLVAHHIVDGNEIPVEIRSVKPRYATRRALVCHQLRKGSDITFTAKSVRQQAELMTILG